MEIITRQMEPHEAAELQVIARHAFSGLEGVGVPKPKQAIVALHGGRIAGAIQYKLYDAGKKKIGYFDYAFVASEFRNQGVGNILYKATANYLWEQGCEALTALVKDDNVGSWKLFQKNGFERASLSDIFRQFGFVGALRLYLGTLLGVANGMDYYVALREKQPLQSKGKNATQLTLFFLFNLLLLLFGKGENTGLYLAAFVILLSGATFWGYVGTVFSRRQWRFRLCIGGGTVCALINLIGGVYPMVGNWYPQEYENSSSFRRDMGLQALTGWVFVLVLTVFSMLANSQQALISYIRQMGSIFLLFRVMAFYPFEAFGGGRVYRWNKGIYFAASAASLIIYFLQLMS